MPLGGFRGKKLINVKWFILTKKIRGGREVVRIRSGLY
jgi:hypothetical protein